MAALLRSYSAWSRRWPRRGEKGGARHVDGAQTFRFAIDADVDVRDLDRIAGFHGEDGAIVLAFVGEFLGHADVVIAVGFEGALDLPFGTPVKALDLGATDLALAVLLQFQGAERGCGQFVVESIKLHADMRRQRRQ